MKRLVLSALLWSAPLGDESITPGEVLVLPDGSAHVWIAPQGNPEVTPAPAQAPKVKRKLVAQDPKPPAVRSHGALWDACPNRVGPVSDSETLHIAQAKGIDARVLVALVVHESACSPRATGSAGEQGLGQIKPHLWTPWLAERGVKGSLYDARTNLRATATILRYQLDRHKNLRRALQAYNGGSQRVAYAAAILRRAS